MDWMDTQKLAFKSIYCFVCCRWKPNILGVLLKKTSRKCILYHLSIFTWALSCFSNSGGRSLNQALEDQAFGVVPGAYQSSHHHTSSSSNHNTIHRRQSAGAAAAAAAAAAATAGEGRTAASTAISPAASHGSATSSLRIRYIFTSFFPRKNYAKLSKE